MYQYTKTAIQLLGTGLFAVVAVSLLAVVINLNMDSVKAQEPQNNPPISNQVLTALGLSASDIQAASGPTNLEIVKQSNVTTVTSGGMVTFTMTMTNHGGNPISYTHFSELYPAELQNVDFSFSKSAVQFDSTTDKHWLIYDPILVGETVSVTVTGVLTSAGDVMVTNTAVVTPIGPYADTQPNNNTAQAQVSIVGYNPLQAIYLPLIFKSPQPTIALAYHENFNSGKPWAEYDDDNCKWYHNNSQFRVEVLKDNKKCLPPAKNENKPELPYRSYGEFEVTAYQDGDPKYINNSGAYGLFINGNGGGTQYIFKVWPNIEGCGTGSTGGKWELLRNLKNNLKLLDSKACDHTIKRGYGSDYANVLRIAHTSSGQLTVYINNIKVGGASDNTLTFTPTGLYAETKGDKPIRIKFDDFKVYKYF